MHNNLSDPKLNSMIRELGIVAHLIGSGLSTIRKADFVQHGKFGSSFFELSLGLERICKLIIIRKYQRLNNGSYPTNNYIRNFSHSIADLIKEVTNGYNTNYIEKDEIIDDIIKFLSEFAKTIRYYNLDSMTKSIDPQKDPMKLWDGIQNKIVSRHYRGKKYSEFEEMIIDGLDDHALFLYRDMKGNLINGAREFFEQGKTVETIQSYSVFYIHRIMVDLVNIIQQEESQYYVIPVMSEFFPYYYKRAFTKQEILKKKKWQYP